MQSIIPGQIPIIPVIVLIVAIAVVILVLLFLKVYQVTYSTGKKYHSKIRTVPHQDDISTPLPVIPGIKQEDISEKMQSAEDAPLTNLGDITKNLDALVSKYHLDAITLSATDGLMIASTRESGQDEAAHYAQFFKQGEAPSVPGMKLFYITHKGSSVIGIIQSDHLVKDTSLASIKSDTEKIMNWWI